MDFDTVLKKVIDLAGEQFKSDCEISENTTAAEVPTWNSLSHVMFIASVENAFDIKFDLTQMIDMKSIGDIARACQKMME